MKKTLLVSLCAAALVACGAVAGWATIQRPAVDVSSAAPIDTERQAPAPPSTVTLSRAARVDGVPLRMDVALLRRAGRTATLDLRLRSNAPHGGLAFIVGSTFSPEINGNLDGVYLIDPATGHRLGVLKDRDDECICTTDGYSIDIAPGGTVVLTASFPAPSPGTRTADVVVPHFGAFRDVTLRS